MLGTFSFSVSSRARAVIGKLRGAIVGRSADEDVTPEAAAIAGASLNQEEYEAKTIETEGEQKVTIFVASTPVYSDVMEEFAPTVIGSAKQEEVSEVPAEPVRREKVVASEPADLFINALKRPVRQKFDTSTPFIKKKEVVSAPVVEEAAVPVVEEVVAPAAPVAVEVVPTFETVEVEPVVADATEIVTITDDRVPAPEITAIEESTIVEAPVVEAVPAPSVVVEAVPVVEEVPVVEAVEAPAVDEVLLESLEADESKIECEIAHDADDAAVEAMEEQAILPSFTKKLDIVLEPIAADVPELLDVKEGEFAMTSVDAVELSSLSHEETINTIRNVEPALSIEDESAAILAFRSELSDDAGEFSSTSYDDNQAYREDYLDRTERTFKIRASSVRPQPRFDGNFRSLARY